MPRDGTKTRTKILDAALELAMQKGLAATSLDEVIKQSGITKGTFFYHFENKQDLATRLVKHFARHDRQNFEQLTERVENLSRDPLQQALLLVGLMADWFENAGLDNPGCLFASFCYQSDLWTEEIRQLCDNQLNVWTEWLKGKLEQAARNSKPRLKTNIQDVAEMLNGVVEGAMILARTAKDPTLIARQLYTYRDFLELLFNPDLSAPRKPGKRASKK